MIDRRSKIEEPIRRVPRRVLDIITPLAALALLGAPADAKALMFPKDHPQVTLDVPDDWTVDTTTTGLELQSPEKTSIVVAQIIGKDKAQIEAWTRLAGQRMKAFGIVFAGTAKSAPLSAPLKAADVPSLNTTGGSTKDKDAFTFSGAPSLGLPGTTGPNAKTNSSVLAIGENPFSGTTDGAVKSRAKSKLPLRSVRYAGTTMNGKDVDAELAIYTLSDNRVFLLMQESEPSDNRSVGIGRSVAPKR